MDDIFFLQIFIIFIITYKKVFLVDFNKVISLENICFDIKFVVNF